MIITPLESMIKKNIGQSSISLSRSSIEAYQSDRLACLIDYCRERSSFYRRKFRDARGIRVKGIEDLASLPLTSEEELRQHGSEMVCVSQDEVARIITLQSSGTTGKPKRLFFTDKDLKLTLDFFKQGMRSLVAANQTVAILLPGSTPDSTGQLLTQALKRSEVSSTILGLVEDPAQTALQLHESNPDVLIGFPVQLLAVTRLAAAMAIPLGPIRSVLFCSDYIPKSISSQLQELLSCEVFSHYGTVETGLGGGVDCKAHCGMHLREDDLLFEIIDPQTAQPLASGGWGEIVFTTLTRTGMPLIRYRTGDWGRLLHGPCPCGSHLQRLDRVFGRINQTHKLQTGEQLSLQSLDELLFPVPGLLDYQASLDKSARREMLVLNLVSIPDQENEVLHQVAEKLATLPALQKLKLLLTTKSTPTIHKGKRILEIKKEGI